MIFYAAKVGEGNEMRRGRLLIFLTAWYKKVFCIVVAINCYINPLYEPLGVFCCCWSLHSAPLLKFYCTILSPIIRILLLIPMVKRIRLPMPDIIATAKVRSSFCLISMLRIVSNRQPWRLSRIFRSSPNIDFILSGISSSDFEARLPISQTFNWLRGVAG